MHPGLNGLLLKESTGHCLDSSDICLCDVLLRFWYSMNILISFYRNNSRSLLYNIGLNVMIAIYREICQGFIKPVEPVIQGNMDSWPRYD